jgi:hypothetical protein
VLLPAEIRQRRGEGRRETVCATHRTVQKLLKIFIFDDRRQVLFQWVQHLQNEDEGGDRGRLTEEGEWMTDLEIRCSTF